MKDNIVKGSIKLEFVYDRESNVLAPTACFDIKDPVSFEVIFRLAASLTECILNRYRENVYGGDYDVAMETADELRERAKDKGGINE